MKKSFFILSICITLAQTTLAQEPAPEPVTSRDAKRKVVPGIKIGVNRSNVYNQSGDAFAADNKQGLAAGVFLALPIGSLLGIQPEVVYQQKGFEGSGRFLGDRYVVSRTTSHIDVPVQLQVKLFKWLTLLGGPNYSYMLKQIDNFQYEGTSVAQNQQLADSDPRRSTFGTIFGIDLNFGHIVFSGRSGWDVSASQSQVAAGAPNYRNRWLQGTIGYRFYGHRDQK